ncbi:BamA/TamA family outer membrane protein [Fibrobacter sp. UWS1]|uniref:BamA/TamA family outer membrane protein n=1 Tax=Fibrobacter sp. UWS1 TaxID=1896220 RepID=UPI000BC3929E|nr:BamA/TamA family outer membrane protein [Fibrobacter sp. UWS1]PBC69338.1 surface antigen-like protein [Fibrobacter sp. UWS1]
MKNRWMYLALLILVAMGVAFAENSGTSSEESFQRFAALPVLGYAEETGLKYGAMVILFTRPDAPGENATAIDFAVMGTTKGQLEVDVSPDLYLFSGFLHSDISFIYWNWRAKYYGIGNDPDRDLYTRYDMDLFKLSVPFEMRLFPSPLSQVLHVGPYFYLEHNRASFSHGDLDKPENAGGKRFGTGYQITLDFRDNVNWPVSGFFGQFRQVFYSGSFGSDFDFFSQTVDLRAYSYLFWGTSVALGTFYEVKKGDVPFDMLATLDGIKRFRGVERGMFLDRQVFSAQVELRKTLFWRLAGTIFFEAGKVGPYFSQLARNRWHYAPGFGGRFLLNKSEKTYVRGDFSLVDGKYLGMTVYIREAF